MNFFTLHRHQLTIVLAIILAAAGAAPCVWSQKAYDPGASDTEIKIGNIAPYTGWGSEYAAVARAEAAYFQMINDRGGINGRKINFVTLDSASEPSHALPLARKLVEEDQVLLIFSSIGTEGNLAIRDYLNQNKVPQLFIQSSSAAFNDPAHFPWTMGFFATYRDEGVAYAKYVLSNEPNGKIAILYANDDAGKEYLQGVQDGLADKAAMIVKEVSYQVSGQNSSRKSRPSKIPVPMSFQFRGRPSLRERFARFTTLAGTRCSSFPTHPSRSPRFWSPQAWKNPPGFI